MTSSSSTAEPARREPARGLPLSVRLIALTSLLLAGVVAACAIYSLRTLEQLAQGSAAVRRTEHEEAIRRHSQLLVQSMVSAAAIPLAESNYSYLTELAAKAVRDHQDLRALSVVDAAAGEETVVSAGVGAVGAAARSTLLARLRGGSGTGIRETIDPQDRSVYVYGAPIAAGGRVLGYLLLAVSTARLERAMAQALASARVAARQYARNLVGVAIAILLVGVALAGYQGARIGRPLRLLAGKAQGIAAGDFDSRVAVQSSDEIGLLARSFNQMAESLSGLMQERADKASLEREMSLARQVQERLSPPQDPVSLGWCAVVGRCEMADACGGDWWNFQELSDGRILLAVGDATGHGMPAAMVAATASGALAVAAPLLADAGREAPRQALLAIHRAISRIGTHAMSCYTLLLARDGSMSYANAGHCFPYVLPAAAGPGGRALKVLAAASNPLGLGAFEIREGECRLDAGDTVVFTTDGIEDRIGKDGARFGLRRFRTLLRGSSNAHDIVALRDEIVAEVEQFAAGAPKDDDMTLVVLRLGAAGAAPGGAVA